MIFPRLKEEKWHDLMEYGTVGGGCSCFILETNTLILVQRDGLSSVIVGSVLLWVIFDVDFWSQCRGKFWIY